MRYEVYWATGADLLRLPTRPERVGHTPGWHWRFVTDQGELLALAPKTYATRAMVLRRVMRLIGHDHMPVHFLKYGKVEHQVMSHLITRGGRVRTCEEVQREFTASVMGRL